MAMDPDEMNQMLALSEARGGSDISFRSDIMRATEKLIDDEFASENLATFPMWVANAKSFKLTFFDMTDAEVLQNLYEAELCRVFRSVPPCMHNQELYYRINQSRMLFMANVHRSVGTDKRDLINERIVLQSQFKHIVTANDGQKGGAGLIGRLLGRQ